MARNSHTTTIDDDIWNNFSKAVKDNNKNINDVLEEFMKFYTDGFEITVTKKLNNKTKE